MATFFQRNKYLPIITLDGRTLPHDMIKGVITYKHAESNNGLLDFSILPSLGIQDLYTYQGASVTCDVMVNNSGNISVHRIFTGIVDIPEIDVLNEWITLRCSDNRDERMEKGEVNPIFGFYSTSVFGDVTDQKSYISSLLSTIPASLDWDGYGQQRLTYWEPKATADFTLTDNFVYRRDPMIRVESRAQIINQVNINFTYNYQRFHIGIASYTWTGTDAAGRGLYGDTYPLKTMITAAADGTGWEHGDILFGGLVAAGYYRGAGGVSFALSNVQNNYTVVAKTQANPDPTADEDHQTINVTDDAGKQVYEAVLTSSVDLEDIFANSCSWSSRKQWSQNIEETYTLTVTAPQSISRYGLVTEDKNTTFTDVDRSQEWEAVPYQPFSPLQAVDQKIGLAERTNTINVLINQANTRILSTHRDSKVTFQRSIWPQIDLRHTVELSTTRLDCRGKVVEIQHTMDVGTGDSYSEIGVAIYRETGSTTPTPLNPPVSPTDSITSFVTTIRLQSRYGVNPSNNTSFQGYTGNRTVKTPLAGGSVNNETTKYQTSFVADSPDIPAAYREKRTLTSSQIYNVNIPINTLVWTTVEAF